MRFALKRGVELLLARGGGTNLARRLARSRALVLAYHNVLPDDARPGGERSLHLFRRQFAEQLDLVSKTHHVVPLPELLRKPSGTRFPRAAITFDDAYQGAVCCAVEELAERGLPATIFIAPALLGGRSFWWDDFAGPDGALDAGLREHALASLRGEDEVVREWAAGQGIGGDGDTESRRSATEEELQRAVRRGAILLGSHSWSHPNLARLTREELTNELHRPLRWLRERFDQVLPWLSYPYGLSSSLVRTAAAEAGYQAALGISGGLLADGTDRFALPRINIDAGLSRDGFLVRTSGLLTT